MLYFLIIFHEIKSDSPTKTRFTALGSYILICLTFVVATVIEMTVLLVLKQKDEEKISGTENAMNANETKSSNIDSVVRKIDKICRVLFPIAFITFNVIYWVCLM